MLLHALKITAVGTPLVSALAVYGLIRCQYQRQRRLAMITAGIVSLAGLGVFLLERQYTCVVASGDGNCLWEGVGSLSLLLFAGIMALKVRSDRPLETDQDRISYMLSMFMLAGWAGLAMAPNLLIWLASWGMFATALYRRLDLMGVNWGFMIVTHDTWYDDR